MNTRILIGCCGWGGGQEKYFSQFPAIEIQYTFYRPPASTVAVRWRTSAPPDFVFCIKAWQLITHSASSPTYRRLRKPVNAGRRAFFGAFQDTDEVWQAWVKTLEIANSVRAEVVLFQCPASFQATQQNIDNLSRFLARVGPQPFRIAWEPRGQWPAHTVRDLCSRHGLIHCVDPIACVDPIVYRSVYADVVYWRLHGKGSYSYRHTEDDLIQLRNLLFAQPNPSGYILFNNVFMKDDAERFMHLIHCR